MGIGKEDWPQVSHEKAFIPIMSTIIPDRGGGELLRLDQGASTDIKTRKDPFIKHRKTESNGSVVMQNTRKEILAAFAFLTATTLSKCKNITLVATIAGNKSLEQ